MGSTPSTTVPSVERSGLTPKGGGGVGARIRSHKEASATIDTSTLPQEPWPRPPSTSNNMSSSPSPKALQAPRNIGGATSTCNSARIHGPQRLQSDPIDDSSLSFNGSLPSGSHGPLSCPPSVSSSATTGNSHILLPVPRPLDMTTNLSPHHQQHRKKRVSSTSASHGLFKRSAQQQPYKAHPSPAVAQNTSTSAGESCSSYNASNANGQSYNLTHASSPIPSFCDRSGGGLGDSAHDGMLSSMIQLQHNDDNDEQLGDSHQSASNVSGNVQATICGKTASSVPFDHRTSTTAAISIPHEQQQQGYPLGGRDSVDHSGSIFGSIFASMAPFQVPAANSLSGGEMIDTSPKPQQQHRNSRSGQRSSQVAFVAFNEIPESQGLGSNRELSAPVFKVRRRSTATSTSSQDSTKAEGAGRAQRSNDDGGESSNIAAASSSEMGGSVSAPSIVAPRQRRKSSCKFLMGSASDLGDAVLSEGDDCSSSSSVGDIHPSRSHPYPPRTQCGDSVAPTKYSGDVLLRNKSSKWEFDKEGLDARANVAEVPRSFFPSLAASTNTPPVKKTPATTVPIELFAAPTMGLPHKQEPQAPLEVFLLSINHPTSMFALNGTCNPTPGCYFSNSMHAVWPYSPTQNNNVTPLKPTAVSMPEFHPPTYDDDEVASPSSPAATLNSSISHSSKGPSSSRPVPRIQLLASRHKRRGGGDSSNNASTVSYPLLQTHSSGTSSTVSATRDFVSVVPLLEDIHQQNLPPPKDATSPLLLCAGGKQRIK